MQTRIVALVETKEADIGRIMYQVSEFLGHDPEIRSVRVWSEEADESDRAVERGSVCGNCGQVVPDHADGCFTQEE